MTTDDTPLFDVSPMARLASGDDVWLETMWGRERCTVVKVHHDQDGFPMATLVTRSGDRISVNIARIDRKERP